MAASFPSPYQALDDKGTKSGILDWQRRMRDQVTGQITKNVGGSSSQSLSTDESYKHILIFTGVLTANINVIVSALTKQWIVTNNTTGAFTLTIKTSGGTGVTIAQTKTATVYGDGTNVVRATPDT